MEKHMAVCPYCGAGCKLNLLVDDGQVIGAEGLDGVNNEGELCLKGLSGGWGFAGRSRGFPGSVGWGTR